MTKSSISFTYRKAENQQSQHAITDIKKFISGGEYPREYLRAYDIQAQNRRSFSLDRMHNIQGINQSIETWLETLSIDHAYNNQRQLEKDNLKILFTGFPRKDVLPQLEELASEHGLWLRKQRKVSKDLDILVIGKTAGAKKIADAQRQDCLILTKEQFLNFLETGEIPDK